MLKDRNIYTSGAQARKKYDTFKSVVVDQGRIKVVSLSSRFVRTICWCGIVEGNLILFIQAVKEQIVVTSTQQSFLFLFCCDRNDEINTPIIAKIIWLEYCSRRELHSNLVERFFIR